MQSFFTDWAILTKIIRNRACRLFLYAGVAELADAPDLGSGVPDVKVQVLFGAPNSIVRTQSNQGSYFFFTRDYFGVLIPRW